MQVKDISTQQILNFLSTLNRPATNGYKGDELPHSLQRILPDIPEKLLRAKMRNLIKKKLITGCACGCRGDYKLL